MSRHTTRVAAILAVVFALVATGPATVYAVFSVGREFVVNTYTVASQRAPSVGVDADGDFVVVWSSFNQDGSDEGVFAQRWSSAGARSGPELQVNTYTGGPQAKAQVAVESDGDFVVVWQSAQSGYYDVFGRRFTSSGTALAAEFVVNQITGGAQSLPAVATDAEGDFVVVWNSFGTDGSGEGVFGRRFASDGSPVGGDFQINRYTTNSQHQPWVATESDGDFVVVWQSSLQDGSMLGVFGQRLTSSGVALGAEFHVNTYTSGDQHRPRVTMLPGGAFVVTWDGAAASGGFEIEVQRFDSSGARVGGEIQVNVVAGGSYSRVASNGDADFVVIWQRSGLRARSFGPGGPAGDELQVDPPTGGGYNAALDINDDGDMIVTWSRSGADGSQAAVLGRRFSTEFPLLDIDLSGGAGALTDGLLLLRHRFGFRGASLVTGATDPLCGRCESTAIESFIAANLSAFDLDGDGTNEPLTDGLLTLRYLFGFRGSTLISGAFDTQNCTRCDATSIEAHTAGLLLPP